jgi:outer membrane protein TolC
VNEVSLKNAIDREFLNQLNLKQSIINQVTSVITAYRSMILSAKNLEIQKIQLKEAKRLYEMNEKKIDAGQLEPTGNIQQAYQIESLNLTLEQATNDFQNSAQTLLQVIGLDPQMKLAVPSDIDLKNLLVPDMKASIQTALAHNADYQAVKLAYKADQRAYEVAKNEQLWDLNVSGNVQTGDMANVDGLGGFLGIYQGKNINQSVRLTLKIPIRDLDQRAKLINAKTQLEKDRVRLTATKRALITEVRNLIHTIASQAKRYQLAVKQVKMAKQSFELQKKRQDAGISTALDVTNTQNQLIQAQLGLMNAKIAYLNQMSTLQRLLGTTLEAWHIKLRNGQ